MESAFEALSFGEPLVGIYHPKDCSITEDTPLSKTWGGDTSNFALALSKLGHQTSCLTGIGSYDFGRSFLKLWKENEVDISMVQKDPVNPTGLYFISYKGEKT